MKKQTILEAIHTTTARSAWSRGVLEYAEDILADVSGTAIEGATTRKELKTVLLNGADNWQHYSEGGCALAYDADIAKRLCTPSEYRRSRGGTRRPNREETWFDVQARALGQAYGTIACIVFGEVC